MAWLEGEDLACRLERGALDIDETIAVARCAAEALSAAHEAGVVHRDVKPSNLFLVDGAIEKLVVLDFGIARLADAAHAVTHTGVLIGTPGYMAPEQARGAREIDARADVFALGCVTFECATGVAPFAGDNAIAVLARILLEDAPRVRSLRPELSAAFDALVADMLSREPGARPANAAAVLERIAALGLAGAASLAPRAPVSLTDREQILRSIVLADPTPRSKVEGDAPTISAQPSADVLQRVRAVATRFAARVEAIVGGAWAFALSPGGAASDQAAHAARCALALREVLGEARIVLATGRAIVTDRAAAGEVIDRAARLLACDQTPGAVVIDELTARLVGDGFDVRKIDHRIELRAERGPSTSARRLLGRASSFVGRDRELRTLRDLYDECVGDPRARVALLTGPPGIGKSRVRDELARAIAARHDGAHVWLARADPLSAGSPFGLMAQIVRQAGGIADGAAAPATRDRLQVFVCRRVDAAEAPRVSRFLAEMLGVGGDVAEEPAVRAARSDPALLDDQIRRAAIDLVRVECDEHPVVILLEDLHWGDIATVRLLDAALVALSERPFMVLAMARPEVAELFPRLWVGRDVQEIRLSALSRRAAEKLARDALAERADGPTVARIVERAAGNALFLEELVRAVVDGCDDATPETVVAMAQTRLERLDAELRRVLRAASVFGRAFWVRGVGALVGAAESSAVDRMLVQSEDLELVARRDGSRFPGEVEFAFRHALVRDAAYGMLTDADRALGHRLAGAWLEAAGERDVDVLAEHAERGEERARAGELFARAARIALDVNDLSRAMERADRALACGVDRNVRSMSRSVQAEASLWRGDNRRALECAHEALAHAERGALVWCKAMRISLVSAGRMGDKETLRALAIEALHVDVAAGAESAIVSALIAAVAPLVWLGERDLGDEILGRAESMMPQLEEADIVVRALYHNTSAVIRSWGTGIVNGEQAFLLAAELYERAGDRRHACSSLHNHGVAQNEIGDYAGAEATLREVLATAKSLELGTVRGSAMHNLALALLGQGRTNEARATAEEAIRLIDATRDPRFLSLAHQRLARILLALDDQERAERHAREAVALASESSPAKAIALGMLATVLLARGDVARSLEAASNANDLLLRFGALDEDEAMVSAAHVSALARSGQVDRARDALAVARDRILARADRLRDAAMRARFLEAVPDHARILSLWRDGRTG